VDFVNHLVFHVEHFLETVSVAIVNKKKNCWDTAALLGLTEGAYPIVSSGRDELLKQDASNSYHATLPHEEVNRHSFGNGLLETPDQGHSPEM